MLLGAVVMTDNQHGFTLVEFLVAIVILMVGMLGMLQAVNVAMDKNLENVIRTEAVILADERMMGVRAQAFASVSTTVSNPPKEKAELRNKVGITFKNYSVQQIVNQVTGRSKEVIINVTWQKRKSPYSHTVSSVITTSD
jgi:type IV pilus assembly protein PilV